VLQYKIKLKTEGIKERNLPPLAVNPLTEWKMLWSWESCPVQSVEFFHFPSSVDMSYQLSSL